MPLQNLPFSSLLGLRSEGADVLHISTNRPKKWALEPHPRLAMADLDGRGTFLDGHRDGAGQWRSVHSGPAEKTGRKRVRICSTPVRAPLHLQPFIASSLSGPKSKRRGL